MDTKKWYMSKTVLAAFVTLVLACVTALGTFKPELADKEAVKNAVTVLQDQEAVDKLLSITEAFEKESKADTIVGIVGIVASLLAMYGRLTAKTSLMPGDDDD